MGFQLKGCLGLGLGLRGLSGLGFGGSNLGCLGFNFLGHWGLACKTGGGSRVEGMGCLV